MDTSVLIAMKRIIRLEHQFAVFTLMTKLLQEGLIAFPRQVRREMMAAKFPDMPGAWAASCNGHERYPAPRDESVAEVLGAAQLVDLEAEDDTEVADPYVVAMAYELQELHPECEVMVATEDRVDRLPVKESILTACERLDLECWTAEQLVTWLVAQLED